MSQNFGNKETGGAPDILGYVVSPNQQGNTGPGNPVQSPVGSVLQPTSYFPVNNNNGKISQGPIPAASNFKSVSIPRRAWNTVANFGNTMNIFKSMQGS